jgi:methionyl-tRNA synthetase
MLLSAGQPLPTDLLVHDYLTADGRKISKSGGVTIDPAALSEEYGTDAVRWWLLREVPRVGDADFTLERLVNRANDELANGFGNLVNRVVAMIHRYRDGQAPTAPASAPDAEALDEAADQAPALIDTALADFDFRRATAAVWNIVDEANRYINHIRPWELAKAERDGHEHAAHRLDIVLAALLRTCQTIAEHLAPFLPDAAARIAHQCATPDGRLPAPSPVFRRLVTPTSVTTPEPDDKEPSRLN